MNGAITVVTKFDGGRSGVNTRDGAGATAVTVTDSCTGSGAVTTTITDDGAVMDFKRINGAVVKIGGVMSVVAEIKGGHDSSGRQVVHGAAVGEDEGAHVAAVTDEIACDSNNGGGHAGNTVVTPVCGKGLLTGTGVVAHGGRDVTVATMVGAVTNGAIMVKERGAPAMGEDAAKAGIPGAVVAAGHKNGDLSSYAHQRLLLLLVSLFTCL